MHFIEHLSKDKKLARLIKSIETPELEKRNHIHLRICASIISQQLSTKVAAIIYNRFEGLFSKKYPTPQDILNIPFDELRLIGLSNAKAKYVQNVCAFFNEQEVTDKMIHKMEDDELINFLVQIKGIGRWTAEMILMFTLGREDVFAVDDLGIQQAMNALYKLEGLVMAEKKLKMIQIAEKWRPYRTYACRYLWAWKDA